MVPGILNKLRRRQSSSLPLRTQHAHSYVHHSSTPPDWPTEPSQATPDVYITSPPEDDGLQTSVCVHRALEHEPKRLRKLEDRALPVAPVATANPDANEVEGEGPPVFRRSSLQAPDVVLPKKPSELSSAKWAQVLNRESVADKGVHEQAEPTAAVSGVNIPATGHVRWEGGHELTRVSSTRDLAEGLPALPIPKPKDTLRRRASKVFKSFTNRDSLMFGSNNSDKRLSQTDSQASSQPQKRRNTLSDSTRPFSIWTKASTTAIVHAIPVTTADDPTCSPPAKTSVEGRRRSSTISHVERTSRPTSPPLPPLPVSPPPAEEMPPIPTTGEAIPSLDQSIELGEPASTLDVTSKVEKPRKLQKKRSKNTFSHLFHLKGEKMLRSPPPAKQEDAPVPPVPVIPQELARAVADPETPEVAQTPTFASPVSTAATPKSSKSKRFGRHRRATISSMSQSQISPDMTGTPSSMSTLPQADTPKTPSSLRSRPFSIMDLRKGFNVRSLGKSKGKLFSAKSTPTTGSPAPPVPHLPEERDIPTTVMQRYKMARPPPLQSSDSPQQSDDMAVPPSAGTMASTTTVEFNEAAGTSLPSPTESEGPVTPMFGTHHGSAPTLALAPAIELNESKHSEEGAPELTFTSEESDPSTRVSGVSEATTVADDPLFDMFDEPSSIGDLQLQLHEPSTKTSTLDAHLRIGSLRFDNFSFDTHGF